MTEPAVDTPQPPRTPIPPVAVAAVAASAVLAVVAVGLSWHAGSRLRDLEQELVRRQAGSQGIAVEAQATAKANAEQLRELGAKLALAEARLAEVALQRGQVEDLLQTFSRSRDENVVGDLEAGLRLATQQTALVGSTEPLLAALRQADERLQRLKLARLDGVRRAVQRDLDRLKSFPFTDAGTLAQRLDEVARLVDELPLLAEPQRRAERAKPPVAAAPDVPNGALERWLAGARQLGNEIWTETKSLVRVTRVERPEAMWIAPEQAFFLRENLKLRLLNARLALLSRQHDAARLDLQAAISAIERHADLRQRRSQAALELLRQVNGQARPVQWPRPDDSLAALAAAGGALPR